MAVIVLVLNAVLYVVALSLSLAVLTPIPDGASRRLRLARRALVGGGGLAMSVAITLSFMERWFESGIAGCVALVDRERLPLARPDAALHPARRGRRRRAGRRRRPAQAPRPAGATGAGRQSPGRVLDGLRPGPRRVGAERTPLGA